MTVRDRPEKCPSCDGKGTVWYDPEGHTEVCQRCEGTGVLPPVDGEAVTR